MVTTLNGFPHPVNLKVCLERKLDDNASDTTDNSNLPFLMDSFFSSFFFLYKC